MLKGRLGLETARIPHVDRHGLVWLRGGTLSVKNGTLKFRSEDVLADSEVGPSSFPEGELDIPFQMVSMILWQRWCTTLHSTTNHAR